VLGILENQSLARYSILRQALTFAVVPLVLATVGSPRRVCRHGGRGRSDRRAARLNTARTSSLTPASRRAIVT